MRARLTLRAALCGWLLAALPGCTDKGRIGDAPAAIVCDPACQAGERCDPELGACTTCADGMPCELPADAGDCQGDDCAQCEDDDECGDDAPVCVDGRCSQCEEDGDCDGEGERECQEGRCVVVEDDEEDDGAGEESEGGDELPGEP